MKPWDLAAGMLMVREAGGFCVDIDSDGNPLETGNILAANADLLPQMKRELRRRRQLQRRSDFELTAANFVGLVPRRNFHRAHRLWIL